VGPPSTPGLLTRRSATGQVGGAFLFFPQYANNFSVGTCRLRRVRVGATRPGMESAAELGSCAHVRHSRWMAVKAFAFFAAVGVLAMSAEDARAEGVLPSPATSTISTPPPPAAPAVDAVAPAPVAETVAPVVEAAVPVPPAPAPATEAAAAVAQAAAPVTQAVAPAAKSAAPVTRAVARISAPAKRAANEVASAAAETKPQPIPGQAQAPPTVPRRERQASASAEARPTPAPGPGEAAAPAPPVVARAVPAERVVARTPTSKPLRPERSSPAHASARKGRTPAQAAAATVVPTGQAIPALLREGAGSRPQPAGSSAARALAAPGGPADGDGSSAGSLMAAALAAGLNLSFLVALVATLGLAVPRPGRRLRLGMASRPPPHPSFALERPG
jgi:hypothetical protein